MPPIRPFARACLTSLLLLTAPAWAQLNLELPDLNLPDMGSPASATLSNSEEYELGKLIFRQLRRQNQLIEDPELTDWIRSLGNRLALHSPNRSGNMHFAIRNSPDINAHTMAGGVVIINSGLILNTQSESELAAVMAHEIAHVSQRHIARMLAENEKNPLMTGLGLLAGAAVASKSPDAAQAIVTGTLALQAHKQIVFSHRAESEADRVGLRILAASGFDAMAMPTFLEKLDRSQSGLYGDISKYLNSHPLTIERLSDTRSRAMQANRTARETPDYLFARAKLQQLTGQPSTPLAKPAPPLLEQYSQAVRYARAGNYPAVLKALGNQSKPLPVALLIAEALQRVGRSPEAEQLLAGLQRAYPGQEAVAVALAEAMAKSNRPQQALGILLKIKTSENTSTEFFETAQRIAQQAGQQAEASLFNAERNLRIGEYRHAKATLEQALQLPNTNPQTTANIRNRLLELDKMQGMEKQLQ